MKKHRPVAAASRKRPKRARRSVVPPVSAGATAGTVAAQTVAAPPAPRRSDNVRALVGRLEAAVGSEDGHGPAGRAFRRLALRFGRRLLAFVERREARAAG